MMANDDRVPGPSPVTRRRFLYAVAVTAPAAFLPAGSFGAEKGQPDLKPTPAAGKPLQLTPEETAGPFFRPNSPAKNNFREQGVKGDPLKLAGTVLDLKGRPVKGALIDFWHADGAGDYDLKGFKCRGHQFTDAGGRYSLETVVPGLYPGRTRHYHVRIQAAHGPVLTTQLFFPNEARNAEDSLFRPDLLLTMHDSGTAKVAAFDFVIRTV
jgi:protocatechuate 3,4-dioxygenase beta subunit